MTTAIGDLMTKPALVAGTTQAKRLRVMQITWSLVAGGSEVYALKLASNLDARRFESLMCAMDQGGKLECEIDRLGIPRFIMARKPGIDWRMMFKLRRLFRQNKVDVIHTHHFNQLFYSALAAKLSGVRIIHTEHDIAQYKENPRLRKLLKICSMFCDRIVAVGVEVEAYLRDEIGITPQKLCVARAGVEVTPADARVEMRRELGLSGEERVAAIVARLSPEKNHALLVSAFAEVVKKMPQAKLMIVGEGPEHAAIRQEIARLGLGDHVKMLGVRRDVPQILSACDAFVLSSNREGLPIAVLEAMAASKPVVATNVGDLNLLVKNDQTGQLVPPHDAMKLAEGLCKVLGDAAAAGQMGKAGRELVAREFSLDAMIKTHEAMYAPER
jgi:glycosyltransferase involved in cell wall biosynthesis